MRAIGSLSLFGVAAALLVVGNVLLPAGCAANVAPGANEVVMHGIAFDPQEITINVGESVKWTNMDLVPHTATSGNPGDADFGSVFRSAQLAHGESFTHTFDQPGEYVYFCEVHPTIMRDAKVIVQASP